MPRLSRMLLGLFGVGQSICERFVRGMVSCGWLIDGRINDEILLDRHVDQRKLRDSNEITRAITYKASGGMKIP